MIPRAFLILLAVAIAALLLLPGCAGVDAVQHQIADRGAQINDEARESALFVLCKGMSVGSWSREFGGDAKRAEAWRILCSTTVTQTP